MNHPTSPSSKDIGDRIIRNIEKVTAHLDILAKEINDPKKVGPNTSRKELETLTRELKGRLAYLNNILKSKAWESGL